MTGTRMTDIRDAELLEIALSAAAAAAAVHTASAGRLDPTEWGEKGRSDFVTEVDLEAERQIVETILAHFPTHGILAEESGTSATASNSTAPVLWIIDPLDGTTNWLHGYPEYAVSIAAQDAEGLRVGVVLNSATGECFEAVRGEGARLNGEPIRVSRLADVRLALVGTGFPFKQLDVLPAYLETFSTVLRNTAGIRRAGAAALDLCDVACGRLDAFFEFHLMPWDVAAGALLVREAGGRFEPLPIPGFTSGKGELPIGGFVAGNAGVWDAFKKLLLGDQPDPGKQQNESKGPDRVE
ncbi:MAG: inositol monophosphatase [Gemmatimonadales bacterium]|nr:MAG: inositol monophosphatase [Gemmatimonadales bacterium]